MSFTNQTTNYGLPQWIGTDKPTYLVDQNGAYATIDSELYNANSNASTALSSAASAVEVAETASTNAQTAITSASTANDNANSAIATANTAITNAASAKSIAESAAEDIDSLFHLIDTHVYSQATTYNTMLDNAGTAIASALSTYPTDEYEYRIEFILSDRELTFTLDRASLSSSGTASGMCVNNAANIWLCNVYFTGSGSGINQIVFSSSGLTMTGVGSTTNTGTVKVSVTRKA